MESSEKTNVILPLCIAASVGIHAFGFLGLGVYVTFKKKKEVVVVEVPVVAEEEPTEVRFIPPQVQMEPQAQPEAHQTPAEQQEKVAQQAPKKRPLTPEEFLKQEKEKLKQKKKEAESTVVVNDPRGYERTTADQESENAPENTLLEGARNTLAKSDTDADANAPDRAAVKGKNPRFDHDRDIIDSRFKDGDASKEGDGATQASAGDPDSLDVTNNLDEILKKMNPLDQKNQEMVQNGEAETNQHAAQENRIDEAPTLETANKIAKNASQQGQNELKQKSSDKPQQQAQRKPKGSRGDQLKDDPFAKAAGMTSEVRKNRIRGSLSRKGKTASRNVKATPLGQYQDAIMKVVEKEWRKQLTLRPEFAIPGQLTMHFFVNKNGKVLDLKVVDEHVGSDSQKGITLKAIRSAAIPAMPRKLQKTQYGQPVEVEIHFSFN